MYEENQPLVSVVIPCYNHENFVQDCIQSVIDQTYQNIELIVIDDGSKDSSVMKIQEMVAKCKTRFTRFEFRNRQNKGLSPTLNEALEWCEGEYYSAIASDDMMLPEKIIIQINYMIKNKKCNALFGGYKLIDNFNFVISDQKKENKIYSFNEIFLHQHDLPAPTQLIRMDSLKSIGGYNAEVIIEDWYMWLKLSKIGEIHYISEYLSLYRYHLDNLSRKVEIMNIGRNQVLDKYKCEKLYFLAKKEIDWIYLRELKRVSRTLFIKKFCIFSIFNFQFVIRKIRALK